MKTIWHQGEHIAIIGATGYGKTTLAHDLLPARDYVVLFGLKRRDKTMEQFANDPNYLVTDHWPPPKDANHVVVWDKPTSMRDAAEQSHKMYEALDDIYYEGGWTPVLDDANYLTSVLGLGSAITYLMNMGRSSGISCVVNCARPRKVPLEAFTQARFVLAFHYHDQRDAMTIAEIAGVDRKYYLAINRAIRGHDFVCCFDGTPMIVRS